jgi:aminoglycoside phosphotransferase (APT) family kinase protein
MTNFKEPIDPAHTPALMHYLKTALGAEIGQLVGVPRATVGGVENRNYVIHAEVGGSVRRLVLRCQPEEIPGWRAEDGLYDMEKEFRVLGELQEFQWGTPRAYGYDAGAHFGVPCFLMDELPGTPLTERLLPNTDSALLRQYAERLAAISRVDYQKNDWMRENLPRWTNDWWFGWFDRLVKPEFKDDLFARAMTWLKTKQPAKRELVFAHGDANPGNFLVSNGVITGIVDWEFAGLSDDPLNEISFFIWLHEGQLAKPLAQELCDVLKRDIKETKWYFVRSWFGITYSAPDPGSELFRMRREFLAQLIGAPLSSPS